MANLLVSDRRDGNRTISTNTTETLIASSCSGSAGTKTLTVGASLSFASGQKVIVWQVRGTGAGQYEEHTVDTYSGTTLTLKQNLANTYTDSGASQAQVVVRKQYGVLTISGGVTWTIPAWDGDTGGILPIVCDRIINAGTIDGIGVGFRGCSTLTGDAATSGQGEGSAADRNTASNAANGNGGGGSINVSGLKAGGGGGGHGAAGNAGSNGGSSTGGSAGSQVGAAALTSYFLGGGGGGAGYDGSGGDRAYGNNGGGVFSCHAQYFENTGTINMSAQDYAGTGGVNVGGGGGGAGGTCDIKAREFINSGTITAAGKDGRTATASSGSGGSGANGRVRIEACNLTGDSTSPSGSLVEGGLSWCQLGGGIY